MTSYTTMNCPWSGGYCSSSLPVTAMIGDGDLDWTPYGEWEVGLCYSVPSFSSQWMGSQGMTGFISVVRDEE